MMTSRPKQQTVSKSATTCIDTASTSGLVQEHEAHVAHCRHDRQPYHPGPYESTKVKSVKGSQAHRSLEV